MPSESRPLLSVVLSFRNEVEVIPELLRRLTGVLTALPIEYELIFVNDASVDDSLGFLTREASRDRHLRIITMSRRFGPVECAMAGLAFAKGAAVVLIDADLQDPPELIPSLVDRWREGADVVYTVRAARRGDSLVRRSVTRAAYRILQAVANIDLPVEAGDFRLMSRRVVDELLKLPERTPYLRGLVPWVGFKQVPVYYERQPRFAGRTHFPLFSLNPWRTFLAGLTSFSTAPLVVLFPLGLTLMVGSTFGVALLTASRIWGTSAPLWWWVALGLALLGGAQVTALGIIGLYLARMYDDVRGRPRYIVGSVVGGDDPSRPIS